MVKGRKNAEYLNCHLMRATHWPGTVLGTFHTLTCWNLNPTLWGRSYHLHPTARKTEALSKKWRRQDSNSWLCSSSSFLGPGHRGPCMMILEMKCKWRHCLTSGSFLFFFFFLRQSITF
jgi:hypothetical protein